MLCSRSVNFQFLPIDVNFKYLVLLLQVIKIKGDEREDLKVLATGVAAALAARKVLLCLA